MKGIKFMFTAVLLLIISGLCFGRVLYPASKMVSDVVKTDSVNTKVSENEVYTISTVGHTEDLTWTAIRKWYYRNSDTILIFNRKSRQIPDLTLLRMNQIQFINKNLLLASGNGRAEFHDLRLKRHHVYQDVIQVADLKIKGKSILYAVLHKEGFLEFFDLNNQLVYQLEGIQNLQSVEDVGMIVHQHESGKQYVKKINASGIELLYSAQGEIQKIFISDDQKYAVVDEKFNLRQQKSNQFTLIYVKSGAISPLLLTKAENFEDFGISKIGDSGSYLLSLRNKIKQNNELVEIWTAKESNLISLYKGKSHTDFFIWHSLTNELEPLESEPEEIFVAFTNSEYLLKYHPNAGHNYTFHYPSINMRLFNIKIKKEISLGIFTGVDQGFPETIYSQNGKYILCSADRENWILWNLETITKKVIRGNDLKHPLYTLDGNSIYFDGKHGIGSYNIEMDKLSQLSSADNHQITILNGEKIRQINKYYFASHTFDSKQPIFYKKFDFSNNMTGYAVLKKGKSEDVIPMTENRIKDVTWENSLSHFNYLMENYHLPTILITKEKSNSKKAVYYSNAKDIISKNLHKEILSYQNKGGDRLKGTLYYPYPFDPEKKYPMVVKIYQVQRYYSNEYMVKGAASYVAYDKRGLVEKGYFVYEPDIMYGNEGTGKGALDCVNNGMEALKFHKNINFQKVALIGHSHGGYSTNYIATQSNRFATYISGAGNSDIVRSYFSYNRNFHTPFYMQFENGQYQMPPFVENKQVYFNNNPIHYVENVNAPILLWAGKKDQNIFWEQVQEFYIGLKRNKKDAIALFYSKAGHDLGINTAEKADMQTRSSEWLDYFLKDKKDVEWINMQMMKK